ncbi:hypothetical protein FISHEDRAFT_61758 [Fistulina hepatica ATCC 64428]|uniref:Uncharacterized protein n=1 Tax=Fistulina hepatica ATCC 64428 TaxID=1128425 RepID=A0A0D7A110_9AGAR|nr:hypothetical protein FISHEDRAFT_61758 [Fistulina hepatica ATCC 64428]
MNPSVSRAALSFAAKPQVRPQRAAIQAARTTSRSSPFSTTAVTRMDSSYHGDDSVLPEYYRRHKLLKEGKGGDFPKDRLSGLPINKPHDVDEQQKQQQAVAALERALESPAHEQVSQTGAIRGRRAKIPVEIKQPDGSVSHPSGFVPPTPVYDMEQETQSRVLGGGVSVHKRAET